MKPRSKAGSLSRATENLIRFDNYIWMTAPVAANPTFTQINISAVEKFALRF